MMGPNGEYLEGLGAASGSSDRIVRRLELALERWAELSKTKSYRNTPVPSSGHIAPPEIEEAALAFRVSLRDLPSASEVNAGRRFTPKDMRHRPWMAFTNWAWNQNWLTLKDAESLVPSTSSPTSTPSNEAKGSSEGTSTSERVEGEKESEGTATSERVEGEKESEGTATGEGTEGEEKSEGTFVVTSVQQVAPDVVERIFRNVLVDNVRGQTPIWKREDVKEATLTMAVIAEARGLITIEYNGVARLQSATQGYESILYGQSVWDKSMERFESFCLVSIGERTGAGTFNQRADDLGPSPMGVAIELFHKEAKVPSAQEAIERTAPPGR